MRIWIGAEMEGTDKGIQTLFVESPIIDKYVASTVRDVLDKESAKVIYFGAGKLDVNYISQDALPILTELKTKYKFVIEFSQAALMVPNMFEFDKNILRTDVQDMWLRNLKNINYKIDTGKDVFVQTPDKMIHTNLADVLDGKYSNTDKQLYPEV